MRKFIFSGLCVLVCLTLYSCGSHFISPVPPEKQSARGIRPYVINGERYYPLPGSEGFVQYGNASWYGAKFHGQPTACGEIYDMNKMSAAHKTLPLGTYVKVVNLANNKQIIVRINDRGPFVKGRIIDFSKAAAKEIDLIGPGVVRVKLIALGKEAGLLSGSKPVLEISDFKRGSFTVQVGAFNSKENAIRLSNRLKVLFDYVDVEVVEDKEKEVVYRVRASKSKTLAQADKIEKKLESMGFEQAFIVRF